MPGKASKASKPEKKTAAERRVVDDKDRRVTTDRRDFPRPEGRRKSGGRRTTDPKDA